MRGKPPLRCATRGASTLAIVLLLASFVPVAQAQLVQCGDCNVDAVLNVVDALVAAQISAGLASPVMVQVCACDVNSDAQLDIVDALIMAQAAAGLGVVFVCPMNPCGNSPPTVAIVSPTGGMQGQDIAITFDTADAQGDPLDLAFSYSIDGGVTFVAMASIGAGGSVTMNPALGTAPALGQILVWQSAIDRPLFVGAVTIRVQADDAFGSGQDTVGITLDNSCIPINCGGSVPGMTGAGSGAAPPTAFTASNTAFFLLDATARLLGQRATITVSGMNDNHDLYIANVGVTCGALTPASYTTRSLSTGTTNDTVQLSDAMLSMYGGMVPFAVHHVAASAMGTFTVMATCTSAPLGTCGMVEGVLTGMPLPITVMGSTIGANDTSTITCGTGGDPGSSDHVYEFNPPMTGNYTVTFCLGGTSYDSMAEVRRDNCVSGVSVGCNDDACGLQTEIPGISLNSANVYYIVVDGWGGDAGAYSLRISSP